MGLVSCMQIIEQRPLDHAALRNYLMWLHRDPCSSYGAKIVYMPLAQAIYLKVQVMGPRRGNEWQQQHQNMML